MPTTQKGGWIGGDQVAPAYKAVENQWIYFYGDHTLRQIASAFLHPNHGASRTLSLFLNCAAEMLS
jgi:hypothetical protein